MSENPATQVLEEQATWQDSLRTAQEPTNLHQAEAEAEKHKQPAPPKDDPGAHKTTRPKTSPEDVPQPFKLDAETAHFLNGLHGTEAENGYAFQRLTKGYVRFVEPTDIRVQKYDGWIVWDRKRWRRNSRDRALQLMRRTAVTQTYVGTRIDDEKQRNIAVRWGRSSMQDRRMSASLHQASLNTPLRCEESQLDKHEYLLNVQNGIIDLKTGELRKHHHEYMLTQITPITYHANAECPLWLDHLDFCFDGDVELIEHVQRLCGYMLIGNSDQQRWWLFLGEGSNGKTTIIETMRGIMGDHVTGGYARHIRAETLQLTRNEKFEMAELKGCRFVDTNEFGGSRINEELVKGLADGAQLSTHGFFAPQSVFVPVCTFVLCSNAEPKIKDTTHAMWRRTVRINFHNQVPETKRVEKYWNVIIEQEGPGVLAWAAQGAIKLCRSGLAIPGSVKDDTRQYELDMNPLKVFIADQCETRSGFKETADALYSAYTKFCEDCETPTMTLTQFGIELKNCGFDKQRLRSNGSDKKKVTYLGIRLKR